MQDTVHFERFALRCCEYTAKVVILTSDACCFLEITGEHGKKHILTADAASAK